MKPKLCDERSQIQMAGLEKLPKSNGWVREISGFTFLIDALRAHVVNSIVIDMITPGTSIVNL